MMNIEKLLSCYNPATGEIPGAPVLKRHLSDLKGCFAVVEAYDQVLTQSNPLLYSVSAVEPAGGEGDLHYGVGMIMPGKIGDEYFMTKGHLHSWRPAAEFYFGLTGDGVMLLEDEATGESRMVELRPNGAVYVPGRTAHRTMNVGRTPLTYFGVYPAKAGHDYAAIAKNNFRCVIIERHGKPELVERKTLTPAARHP
jgi:glucose-6-phosphate isomerase